VGEPVGVAGRLWAGGKKGRSLRSETEVRRFQLPAHLLARPSVEAKSQGRGLPRSRRRVALMASGPSALKVLAQASALWLFALGLLCVQLVLCWGLLVCSVL